MAYWTCNDCERYDRTDTNRYDECYCTYYNKYFARSDRACSRFEQRSEYIPNCFLTTAICNIFGFEDNCLCLETMRNFRDTVLVNDPKYYSLLAEYEVVGPTISAMMNTDEHGLEVAEYYFENYIYCIFMNLLTKKDYNEAVDKYVEMVNDMKRMYKVTKEVSEEDIKSLTKKIENKQYKVKNK